MLVWFQYIHIYKKIRVLFILIVITQTTLIFKIYFDNFINNKILYFQQYKKIIYFFFLAIKIEFLLYDKQILKYVYDICITKLLIQRKQNENNNLLLIKQGYNNISYFQLKQNVILIYFRVLVNKVVYREIRPSCRLQLHGFNNWC